MASIPHHSASFAPKPANATRVFGTSEPGRDWDVCDPGMHHRQGLAAKVGGRACPAAGARTVRAARRERPSDSEESRSPEVDMKQRAVQSYREFTNPLLGEKRTFLE